MKTTTAMARKSRTEIDWDAVRSAVRRQKAGETREGDVRLCAATYMVDEATFTAVREEVLAEASA